MCCRRTSSQLQVRDGVSAQALIFRPTAMVLRQVPPATPVTGAPSLVIATPDLEVTEGAPPPDLA
eukprot:2399241-Alexandrium_andersonii.AAC.1